MDSPLTIGQVAERTGVAASALRFYEDEGLMRVSRTPGGQRRYGREVLRRVAFMRAAQSVGLSLEQIRAALDALPDGRTPSASDWDRLSASWRQSLDTRIEALVALRDDLTGCIGCGCLSLDACALVNSDDRVAVDGPGARFLGPSRGADTHTR